MGLVKDLDADVVYHPWHSECVFSSSFVNRVEVEMSKLVPA
jgi:hypothetical protein